MKKTTILASVLAVFFASHAMAAPQVPSLDSSVPVLQSEMSLSSNSDEVRKAYRDKAKSLHPDILRAQGLSEELMGRANEQMAKINDAWAEIKRERGMR